MNFCKEQKYRDDSETFHSWFLSVDNASCKIGIPWHFCLNNNKTNSRHYAEMQDQLKMSPPPVLLNIISFVTRTSYLCKLEKKVMREIGVSRPQNALFFLTL